MGLSCYTYLAEGLSSMDLKPSIGSICARAEATGIAAWISRLDSLPAGQLFCLDWGWIPWLRSQKSGKIYISTDEGGIYHGRDFS